MAMCACDTNPAICNALLGFVVAGLQSSTAHSVRRAVLGHFAPEAIHEAKEALWKNVPSDLIGKMALRRGSQSKSKEEFEIDDLLEALSILDKKDATPLVHIPATQLLQLPRLKPEAAVSMQVIERLSELEMRMDEMNSMLTQSAIDNRGLSHRVLDLEQRTTSSSLSSYPLPDQRPLPPQSSGLLAGLRSQEGRSTGTANESAGESDKWSYAAKVKKPADPSKPKASTSKRNPVSRQLVRQATSKLKMVRGTGTASGPVTGTQPAKHLYVYRVNPDVPMDDLKNHIVKAGVHVRGIRRISRDDWLHSAYKVDINAKDLDRALEETFWPVDVCVREWMPYIPRSQVDTNSNNGDAHE